MKIVSSANQKGGVAKTTFCVHLAFYLSEVLNKRVLVVDTDPQGNASSTLRRYLTDLPASDLFNKSEVPSVAPVADGIAVIGADRLLVNVDRAETSVIDQLDANLQSLKDNFDYCLIDTSPSLSLRTTAALFVSDYVFSPMEVEVYSVEGVTQLLQTVHGVMANKKRAGLELQFLGMIPTKVNNTSPTHLANLRELTHGSFSHMVLPAKVSHRTSVGEALAEGVPVWKMKKTAAREAGVEFKNVLAELAKRMGEEVVA